MIARVDRSTEIYTLRYRGIVSIHNTSQGFRIRMGFTWIRPSSKKPDPTFEKKKPDLSPYEIVDL